MAPDSSYERASQQRSGHLIQRKTLRVWRVRDRVGIAVLLWGLALAFLAKYSLPIFSTTPHSMLLLTAPKIEEVPGWLRKKTVSSFRTLCQSLFANPHIQFRNQLLAKSK